jgi:hypothetical protein
LRTLSIGSQLLCPVPEPLPHYTLAHSLLSLLPSLSLVITVCVKEEHLDCNSPDKAPGPELPIPIESIKQETDN